LSPLDLSTPVSKNFSLGEFACPHCSAIVVDPELVRKLQACRDELGMPIRITSAYRCAEHNKRVGGKQNSQHLKGSAADITSLDNDQLFEIAQKHFLAVGDGRKKGFIHVDTRADRRRAWKY